MSETSGAALGNWRRLGVGARQYGHHWRPSSGPALMADPAGAAVTAMIGHRIEPRSTVMPEVSTARKFEIRFMAHTELPELAGAKTKTCEKVFFD